MEASVWIVTGDNYNEYATNDSVVCFSELAQRNIHPGDTLVVGQGLTQEQRAFLMEFTKNGVRVTSDEPECPHQLTHKSNQTNVLVSAPKQIANLTYRSLLQLGQESDRLVDHVTGQHVNGMLLIEAARQAGIAAIEKHYLAGDERKWSFSWTRCDTRFIDFAFPVPTAIVSRLPAVPDFERLNQVAMTVPISIQQGTVLVSEILMEVTLIDRTLAGKLEKRRAKRSAALAVAEFKNLSTVALTA